MKYDPFSGDGLTGGKITLITSGETFTRLTGITNYSLIMIQTTSGVTDEEVAAIRQIVEENGYTMNDKRGISVHPALILPLLPVSTLSLALLRW